jgi:hypothetical protein
MPRLKLIGLLAGIMFLGASQAGATVYDVDASVGPGSVSGFIQTDGDTGTLGQADVTGWNLTINDGGASFDLLGPQAGPSENSGLLLEGSDLSATPTSLFYNFSGNGFALFQNPHPGSGMNYVCFAATVDCDGVAAAITVRVSGFVSSAQSGNTLIGTTPLPAALPLFAGGLGVMSLLTRRKKRKNAAALAAA